MSIAVLTPPVPPHRWTLSAYRQLNKTGLFHDVKTMLIDGEIFVMPMPNPPHDTALGLTDDYLRRAFATGYHVRNQMGFDIGAKTDPGPDLAVVPGSIRDYANQTPTSAVLVVEISESSLPIDTTKKVELYATASVPDYWVIDLENRKLHVFRDPEPKPTGLGATAYKSRQSFDPSDSISPLAMPSATVKVADLLP